MEKKIQKLWGYLLITLILAIGVVLTGASMMGCKSGPDEVAPLIEEKNRELAEKDSQIQDINIQMAQLREELEYSSKQVADLKARLEETKKALSSTRQRLKSAKRKVERLAATPAQPRKRVAPKPLEAAPPIVRWRPAEPGTYEVIRTTSVFEEPSGSSQEVSTIDKGTRVRVVGSVEEWLEVRSKHGNPPGFIRRDDAMFVEKAN